ncbi:hypothetical protein AGMMS50293_27950 [Spirochaetia bacterium]|nr:hypothetical protein AGMMS50293_27950 [Spirochaetia bacterium]
MSGMGKAGKKNGLKKFLITLLFIFIGIPLAWIVFSLVGRLSPASLIPDAYICRLRIHNPVRLADGFLEHESLPELINSSALAPAAPYIKTLQESALLKKPLVRFAARGNLEGVLLGDTKNGPATGSGAFAAAWDSGFLSPLLRFLPFFSRFVTVPNLYYVQAGKLSRFEYRLEGGLTFYIGPRRNLLVICNNQKLFEFLISGEQTGQGFTPPLFTVPPKATALNPADYDAVILFSSAYLNSLLAGQDSNIAAVMRNMEFPGIVEGGISVSSGKLDLQLTTGATSQNPALSRLLEQRSPSPDFAERLPAAAQYSTILSAGSLKELYEAAAVFSGPSLGESIDRADRSARLLLGLSIDELLFSWSGREFAVFGMEGRPHPVYAVQITDEPRRQEVFNKAFKTIVLNENVQLNLDGVRIPRIEIPEFLQALLGRWDLRLPSPYYTVQNGFLLISESAETLLSAVRAMQKNDVLPKTAAWRNLAGAQANLSAFSLYYSLDRSLPFFLRGNTAMSSILGVYRQGLLRLGFDRGQVLLSLAVIPGSGRGLALMSGYPLAVGGNPQNRVLGILTGKAGENRILLGKDGAALAINPTDNRVYEMETQGRPWIIPAEGLAVKSAEDAAAWVVSAQGRVTLVNGNMEPVQGFPISTGMKLSSPPAAYGGRLYLSEESNGSGKVQTVDSKGGINSWETIFPAALRSPPSFLSTPKIGRTYAGVYPKSFFDEIWLLDADGNALPNWPAPVPGIAFGSPVLFAHNSRTLAAFITMAGELSVFDENAAPLPPFPLAIDGIFYLQPVFDGTYLWLVSEDGTLYQVSLEGEILHQTIPHFQVKQEGYITVCDTDGDKTPEIFIAGEGNALHGYSRNFRSLEGFPLPVWGQPLFADLNGNGKIECIGVGMDRLLYRWEFR